MSKETVVIIHETLVEGFARDLFSAAVLLSTAGQYFGS